MDLAPGAVIGGKYRIERPLARGGMGSLWVARHLQLGSTVAIKFLDPGFAASPTHRARFEREARAAAALRSPHVVNVQDQGFEGTAPYIVMELLEGEDLGHRLHRVRRMSIPDTARILSQVAKALRRAHEAGIAHRDLKPANLFLARVDDEEVVKILDFGIAKEQHSTLGDATRTGEMIGSPHYMSPEQVRAERDVDHRTDLWSVGIILFRMLVGVLPFPGDQLGPVIAKILTEPVPVPTRVAPDLPPALDGFFDRALARDKYQRFQSIGELVEAFHLATGGREALPSIVMTHGAGPMSYPAPVERNIPDTTLTGSSLVTAASTGLLPELLPYGATPMPGVAGSGVSGPFAHAAPAYPSGQLVSGAPISQSGQPATAAPISQSGPLATAAPISQSGQLGHSSALSASSSHGGAPPNAAYVAPGYSTPPTGSVTSGGLTSTGARPRPNATGALIILGSLAVTAIAAAAVTFVVLRSPADGTAAAQPTASAALSADPAPVASTPAPLAEPPPSAEPQPSAEPTVTPSEPGGAASASATASPSSTSKAWTGKPKGTSRPKEKWF